VSVALLLSFLLFFCRQAMAHTSGTTGALLPLTFSSVFGYQAQAENEMLTCTTKARPCGPLLSLFPFGYGLGATVFPSFSLSVDRPTWWTQCRQEDPLNLGRG